jgi:hypothetical protein
MNMCLQLIENKPPKEDASLSPKGFDYGKKLTWFEELIEKTFPEPTTDNNRLCNGKPCR